MSNLDKVSERNRVTKLGIDAMITNYLRLERENVAAIAQADAMDEFLGAAAKREKEAAAIINSLTADIKITVPIRDYSEMSPLDCYELGMMDGVAALKEQIHAAIDKAMKEQGK